MPHAGRRALAGVLPICGALAFAAHAHAQSLYPPLDNPKVTFQNNAVRNPAVPDIAGATSPWWVAQFAKSEALDPAEFRYRADAPADPVLGRPAYSVATADGQSGLAFYRARTGAWFELRARDGIRQVGGSSNLFLSANPLPVPATFDAPITYDVDAKIPHATASYDAAGGRADAGVLAHVFTGFILHLHGSAGAPDYAAFIQIAHAATRSERNGLFECQIQNNGHAIVVGYQGLLPGDPALDFAPDSGPAHHLHFRLNDYLCALLATRPTCRSASGETTQMPFTGATRQLRNWTLGGTFVGLETHNRDTRPVAPTQAPQGSVAVALQLANFQVVRRPGGTVSCD